MDWITRKEIFQVTQERIAPPNRRGVPSSVQATKPCGSAESVNSSQLLAQLKEELQELLDVKQTRIGIANIPHSLLS